MEKILEVGIRIADTRMVQDLLRAANEVVSRAVEHKDECRAIGVDFCVVCANVDAMVSPLREFMGRWSPKTPPGGDQDKLWGGAKLELYGGPCIICDQMTRRSRPPIGSEGGAYVYECVRCTGQHLPKIDIKTPTPPVKVPPPMGPQMCYYCQETATRTIREPSATRIMVCDDHKARVTEFDANLKCPECLHRPAIRIPIKGGEQIQTCIPCAKSLRATLVAAIELTERQGL